MLFRMMRPALSHSTAEEAGYREKLTNDGSEAGVGRDGKVQANLRSRVPFPTICWTGDC